MTTKGNLNSFFNTENEELKLIEKYEENISFFNDLLMNGHKEDIEFVVPIKIYKYADSLQRKGYYTKALKILDEVEKDLEKLRGQSKWYEMYSEGVMFFKGVSLGRLKKYRESNKYFKQLVEKNPTNDNFINWYKSNKQYQIEDISNFIVLAAMTIFFVCFILRITNTSTSKILLITEKTTLVIGAITFISPRIWMKIIK